MRTFFFFIWAMAALAVSCKKGRCLKGAGAILTENRPVTTTTGVIFIEDKINLIITEDAGESLLVEAGENLLPFVETNFSGDTLYIFSKNRCDWLRSFKKQINVHFSGEGLQKIIYNGEGNLFSTNTILSDTFGIEQFGGSGTVEMKVKAKVFYSTMHTGTADMKISGQAEYAYLYSTSSGPLDCSGLTSDFAVVNNSGTNTISLSVSKTLRASIHSSGNICYKGDSVDVNTNITGTGKLVKKP